MTPGRSGGRERAEEEEEEEEAKLRKIHALSLQWQHFWLEQTDFCYSSQLR